MTIEKMLVASTANISESTSRVLADLAGCATAGMPIVYEKAGYGWWVHVWPRHYGKAPYELRGLLDKAVSSECVWLMLDRDADPVEGFPTFDW